MGTAGTDEVIVHIFITNKLITLIVYHTHHIIAQDRYRILIVIFVIRNHKLVVVWDYHCLALTQDCYLCSTEESCVS